MRLGSAAKCLMTVMMTGLIWLTAVCAEQVNPAAVKFFERGNEFVKKESHQRAKLEYEKALKIAPEYADALYNLGVVCERLGLRDDAVANYKRYVALKPKDADAWNQLGVLADDSGDKAEALMAYEKAIALAPDFGRAHHNLGVLLKEQGKFPEAEQHLQKFVELEEAAGRKNGDAYYSLAILYLAGLRVKEAKLLLQKALDVDPSVTHYNNAMGDVYLLENQPDMAMLHYKRTLDKDPKYAPAYSGLGEAQTKLGQVEQAAVSYRKALELRPDYSLVYYKLGRLYEETNPAEAIKAFEKYLQSAKNPQYRDDVTARLERLKQSKKATSQ